MIVRSLRLSLPVALLFCLSGPLCAASPSHATDKVYCIATLSIDPSKSDEFESYLNSARIFRTKRGVDLVAGYRIQFGEDATRLVIWSASDAQKLREALSATPPDTHRIVQSETVEMAELNAVASSKSPADEGISRPGKVFAIVWVSIDPSKHDNFVRALKSELPIQSKYGVDLVASYHVQIGNMAREIDVWSATDAETIRRGFYAPDSDVPAFNSIIKGERIEIGELITLPASAQNR